MNNKKHLLIGLLVCSMLQIFVIPVNASLTKEAKPYMDSFVSAGLPDDNYGSSDYLVH